MQENWQRGGWVANRLASAPAAVLTLYAIIASFSTYFCMYAFRKPFSAATFEGLLFFGTTFELKTVLVSSQIIGYAISKYAGIKFCSEIQPSRRAAALVLLILWAQGALVLFGLAPDNLKFAAIFLNGLPLGMVWGMVVGYLEGRRTSEMLLAGLSCSFIIASGVVKDIGRKLMSTDMGSLQMSESWMPAAVGFLFLIPFLIAVWLLNQVPQADDADVRARTLREPMDNTHRLAFLKHFFWGLAMLMVAYVFLTAFRDFRDNYMVELFDGLGYPYEQNETIITRAELMVAFGVLAALAALNLIKNNRLGLIGAYVIMTAGLVLMTGSTLLLEAGRVSGFWWMTLVGLGSYLAYVPFGSVLFDRLIASTKVVGTAVFAIYIADAIGYTGSVGTMWFKDLGMGDMSRLEFFKAFTYFMSGLGTVMLVGSCLYFLLRHRHHPTEA